MVTRSHSVHITLRLPAFLRREQFGAVQDDPERRVQVRFPVLGRRLRQREEPNRLAIASEPEKEADG